MAFKVGLAFKIDAVFVAEIVEVRVVGVVGGAHMVDVGTLHGHDLVFHLTARDDVSRSRIGVVPVDTFQLQCLAVDVEIASGQSEFVFRCRCVLDLHSAEAGLQADRFHHFLALHQFAHKHIDVGLLRCPRGSLVKRERRVEIRLPAVGYARTVAVGLKRGGYLVVVAVELVAVERPAYLQILGVFRREVLQGSGDVERAFAGIVGRNGLDVSDVHLRRGGDVNIAEDAGQTKHVLSLEKTAVRGTIHFYRHFIPPLVHIFRDVEASSVA